MTGARNATVPLVDYQNHDPRSNQREIRRSVQSEATGQEVRSSMGTIVIDLVTLALLSKLLWELGAQGLVSKQHFVLLAVPYRFCSGWDNDQRMQRRRADWASGRC